MAKKINSRVTWVGKIDWELTRFHGEELSTHRGSSYNAYLVRGRDKTVLIDTVWKPYCAEFVQALSQEINLSDIDAIIANHGEVDHSGSLAELLKAIPDTPVYCTANGVKSMKGQYHCDWNFQVVKTGDKISLGDCDLIFFEAPMLHWPDTMFTYMTGDNILFSNDAFGQHYASEELYADLVDHYELEQEALKYYANILTPYSPMVTRKIQELRAMNQPLDMLCPSHGLIWRKDPRRIIKLYEEWAANYQENQITVLYDTMWNATRHMAEAMVDGIHEADPDICVKVYNVSRRDHSDIITEVFKARAILAGSPTFNRGILTDMAGVLEEIRGMGFKNKKAAAFGSYGWSGESVKAVADRLQQAGFTLVNDGLKQMWEPSVDDLANCRLFGAEFVKAL